MEEEAERIYKDERGLLLDDEAASTRDAMYDQAEFIEREMEQMTEQIKSIIQTLNSNQGGLDAIDGMTPLDVVVRILNNQLSSLMWIDEKAEEFSSRIQKLATQGSAADRELDGSKILDVLIPVFSIVCAMYPKTLGSGYSYSCFLPSEMSVTQIHIGFPFHNSITVQPKGSKYEFLH
ncbi:hypothetical protein Patl1_00157 [Pistacia atlantica]|uniref:Uncharacterized protein n=1 Tax=Pistacia atlantica TaxID=434234 RepID=A0ACC1CBV6_9ROSI|nr:hypothetical protein Patl1_00157 [Pistacia atlantica]